MSTFSQLALAASVWAAASSAALAAPWTQDKLLAEYPELKLAENAVPCTTDKQRVLILFDADKRAAALVSDCSVGAVRKLQELLELGDTVEDETPTCLVVLRADLAEGYKKRLPENDPLHAMGFLLRQAYYRPAALQADGRVLWATGKHRSLDVLVPAVGNSEIHAVEVKAGMKIDNFAANVLARKLGYPADTTSDATKAEQCAKMRCDGVFYFLSAKDIAVATKGARAFIGECGKEGIRGRMTAKPAALAFTEFVLHNKKQPPTAAPKPAPTQTAAPAPPKPAELTPAQALKDYLRKLRRM